jgi:aldose 1-epimerase
VPPTPLIQLEAGALRLELAPAVGGSISRFDSRLPDGRTVEWLRPATHEGLASRNPLAMASFPLVPFCNRIRNGRASFEGREIRFPPNHPAEDSPHPLHGIGWQQAWEVIDAQADRATLQLEVPATAAWPWRFRATQVFELRDDRLQVSMAIENRDDAAMPAGIGHHPYFPHTPGTRITSPAAAMWVADDEVMPTALESTEAVRLLREGVELSRLHLDNNFTGWEHRTLIEWPAGDEGPARSLRMEAQPPLDFFVLYCPQGYPFFCAEPVSQCTDWLNLAPRHGPAEVGGTRVVPGQTLTASFTLAPHI